MPAKKKNDGIDVGVELQTSTSRVADRYEDGVAVHVTDAPEQTAGANDGRSAGTKKEKD